MPSWLASVVRIPQAIAQWGYRRVQRRFANRETLVREGAEIVTPVIDIASTVSPTATMLGTHDEVVERMTELETSWRELRKALLTYANLHPSDEVRRLAHDTANALSTSFNATAYQYNTR